MIRAEGVRLMELSSLREALEPLLYCRVCSTGKLDLQEDKSKADRLYSALYLACGTCTHRLLIDTSRSISETGSRCQWEVNRCTEEVKISLNLEEGLLIKIFHTYGVPYHISDSKNNSSQTVEKERDSKDYEGETYQIDDGIESDSEVLDNDPEEKVEADLDNGSQNLRNQNVSEDDAVALLTKALDDQDRVIDEFLKVPESDSSRIEASTSKSTAKTKTYTCLICHREFRRLGALKQHSREHNEQETFSCPVCMETFQEEASLKQHTKTHVKSNLQCNVCGKTFKKTFNLNQHARTHTGEKPFLCSTCGKSFGDPSTLNKHQKSVHSSERSLECYVCNKTFYHAGHFKVHMRRHTGEKPYCCDLCSKAFAYPDSLKKHKLTHTDQRRFHCACCGRSFRWRESLKQHSKTHGSGQWQQSSEGQRVTSDTPTASEPIQVPVSVARADMVSLTQVIPYLETIRVEYY